MENFIERFFFSKEIKFDPSRLVPKRDREYLCKNTVYFSRKKFVIILKILSRITSNFSLILVLHYHIPAIPYFSTCQIIFQRIRIGRNLPGIFFLIVKRFSIS